MSIHPPQFPGTHRTPLPRTLIDIILVVTRKMVDVDGRPLR